MNAITQITTASQTAVEAALNAGYRPLRTPIEKHARHSDNLVLRLLAISVRSLRYWSEGFDEDDEVAKSWREFHGKEVDDLLSVLKARGIN